MLSKPFPLNPSRNPRFSHLVSSSTQISVKREKEKWHGVVRFPEHLCPRRGPHLSVHCHLFPASVLRRFPLLVSNPAASPSPTLGIWVNSDALSHFCRYLPELVLHRTSPSTPGPVASSLTGGMEKMGDAQQFEASKGSTKMLHLEALEHAI